MNCGERYSFASPQYRADEDSWALFIYALTGGATPIKGGYIGGSFGGSRTISLGSLGVGWTIDDGLFGYLVMFNCIYLTGGEEGADWGFLPGLGGKANIGLGKSGVDGGGFGTGGVSIPLGGGTIDIGGYGY